MKLIALKLQTLTINNTIANSQLIAFSRPGMVAMQLVMLAAVPSRHLKKFISMVELDITNLAKLKCITHKKRSFILKPIQQRLRPLYNSSIRRS